MIEDPVLPGQYFPRVSGMRFTYDLKRPQFDVVQKVELGSLESGYEELDVSESADKLYSFIKRDVFIMYPFLGLG